MGIVKQHHIDLAYGCGACDRCLDYPVGTKIYDVRFRHLAWFSENGLVSKSELIQAITKSAIDLGVDCEILSPVHLELLGVCGYGFGDDVYDEWNIVQGYGYYIGDSFGSGVTGYACGDAYGCPLSLSNGSGRGEMVDSNNVNNGYL